MQTLRSHRLAFVAACALVVIATFTIAQQQQTNRIRSLKYVPRDALAVFAVDVQAILSSSMLSASAAEIGEERVPIVELPLRSLTDVTYVFLPGGACAKFDLNPEGKQLFLNRVNSKGDAGELAGVKFIRNFGDVFHQLDDGSFLWASSELVLLRILKTESAETTLWASQWSESKAPAVALLNTSLLRGQQIFFEDILPRQKSAFLPKREVVLNGADRIWIEFQPAPAPALTVRGQCATPEEAASFENSLRTAISWARVLLSSARMDSVDIARGGKGEAIPIMDFLDKILEFATVQRKDLQVAGLARVSDADNKKIPSLFALAVKTFRIGRSTTATQDNLKQIAIAMLNYEATYKRLPAAVQEGPNRMPRSWRVTILPYIEQLALYNRYKQDEPWDSPSNLKLLHEIPKVYQGSKGGTNSAYFVFDGVNAVFNQNKGVRLGEITDGTSNTILAIEAELDIPWTKPEDIPFDENGQLPAFLTKGFQATAVDGGYHFVPPNANEKAVKDAIIKNDGRVNHLFQR